MSLYKHPFVTITFTVNDPVMKANLSAMKAYFSNVVLNEHLQ